MCNICISAHEGQNKASDPLELELGGGCYPSCGCGGLNTGPLQEQPVSVLNC